MAGRNPGRQYAHLVNDVGATVYFRTYWSLDKVLKGRTTKRDLLGGNGDRAFMQKESN